MFSDKYKLIFMSMYVKVAQSSLTLCDLMDYIVSRPEYWSGSPFPSLRESSQSRDQTQVSLIAGGFFTS